MTLTADAELLAYVAGVVDGELDGLDQLGPPSLPRPASPHRITRWGGLDDGRTHTACSCTPDLDPAAAGCVDFSRLADLLDRTLQLATAVRDAKQRTWPEPEPMAPLKAAAMRQRGTALLGLIVAAGGVELHPSPAAEPDASRRDPDDASAHGTAPVPAVKREALGETTPASGVVNPHQSDRAPLATGADPDTTAGPPAPAAGTPWRPWYVPAWQQPPKCPTCGRHHYARYGGGHARPCTRTDPVTAVYDVCRVCGWTIDPVAAAAHGGRHPECDLPPGERQLWLDTVRERQRRRRAGLDPERTDR